MVINEVNMGQVQFDPPEISDNHKSSHGESPNMMINRDSEEYNDNSFEQQYNEDQDKFEHSDFKKPVPSIEYWQESPRIQKEEVKPMPKEEFNRLLKYQ